MIVEDVYKILNTIQEQQKQQEENSKTSGNQSKSANSKSNSSKANVPNTIKLGGNTPNKLDKQTKDDDKKCC